MKIGKSFSFPAIKIPFRENRNSTKAENHMIRLLHKGQQQQQQVNDISEKGNFDAEKSFFLLFQRRKVEQRKIITKF